MQPTLSRDEGNSTWGSGKGGTVGSEKAREERSESQKQSAKFGEIASVGAVVWETMVKGEAKVEGSRWS